MFLQVILLLLPVIVPQIRSPLTIAAGVFIFLAIKLFPFILWFRFVRSVRRVALAAVNGTAASDPLVSAAVSGAGKQHRNESAPRSFAYCSKPLPQRAAKGSSSFSSSGASSVVVRLVRRAVVVVGGDFARSPRMQYHAVSLSDANGTVWAEGETANASPSAATYAYSVASQKLFDEVFLIGYDCGNALSEEVQRRAADACGGNNTQKSGMSDALLSPISVEGLFVPPAAPHALVDAAGRAGGRKAQWAIAAIYKVVALTARLATLLPRALLPTIAVLQDGKRGAEGPLFIDIIIPQLVLCQTPPAIPFVPLIRFIAGALSIVPDVEGRWAKLLQIECGPGPDSGKAPASATAAHRVNPPNASASSGATRRGPATALPMWLSSYTRPRLAVDWHNFGYTIMHGDGRPWWMVAIYKACEKRLCRGDLNLTVSGAMRRALTLTETAADTERLQALRAKPSSSASASSSASTVAAPLPPHITPFAFGGDSVKVLHDHSPATFCPTSAEAFVRDVLPVFEAAAADGSAALGPVPEWVRPMMAERAALEAANSGGDDKAAKEGAKEKKRSTEGTSSPSSIGGNGEVRGFPTAVKGRIIVASTSWTADDDYSIVVRALQRVDVALKAHNDRPVPNNKKGEDDGDDDDEGREKRYLWFVATGKGVARPAFEAQVRAAGLSEYVSVTVIYFQSMATYAAMLGGADAGLSLHYSSSGLDLPMKCVDMLGAGLPVLALRYAAIGELIDEEGREGWLFDGEGDLASAIAEDILGLPPLSSSPAAKKGTAGLWDASNATLAAKRAFVASRQRKWDDDWLAVALPALEDVLGRRPKSYVLP